MHHTVRDQLEQFLSEDIGSGDITSALLATKDVRSKIITREKAVVAGTRFAKMIFESKGCSAKILKSDGAAIGPGDTMLSVSGDAASVLACERTALNLLSRMSGIATLTRQIVDSVRGRAEVYSTRKTAPGLRYFDKMAVEAGGGHRHRMRLDDMVMIKDNHIAAEGSLESLIKKAKKTRRRFEVEVEGVSDAILAARHGAAIVMLDNFTPPRIREVVRTLKKDGLREKVLLEASGRIGPDNASRFARTGVDIISIGSITSSVTGIDLSLEI